MIEKKKSGKRILLWTLVALLVLSLVAGVIFICDDYPADMDAIATFGEGLVQAEEIEGGWAFVPQSPIAGMIFYPGGKVDARAYFPLMQACAAQGILCVLFEMPLQLAVLDMYAADGAKTLFPEIADWYMAGHSHGGAMAGSYLTDRAADYKGLVLLGAYSAGDLSTTDLRVLTIYGSEDGVMNREQYESSKEKLPADFEEFVLSGGCHAYFGMYGAQNGDGTPMLTAEEQITATAQIIGNFVLEGI